MASEDAVCIINLLKAAGDEKLISDKLVVPRVPRPQNLVMEMTAV